MFLLISVLGCVNTEGGQDAGLTGDGALWPFPNVGLIAEDGALNIPQGALPQVPEADDGSPWAVERLNWRDGFSTVQTAVALIDGVKELALPRYPRRERRRQRAPLRPHRRGRAALLRRA